MPFRMVWSVAALVGSVLTLEFVWLLADTLNALMAVPNLIALIVLSPIVFKITKEFFDSRGESEQNPFQSQTGCKIVPVQAVRLYQSQTACLVQAKGCSGMSGGI